MHDVGDISCEQRRTRTRHRLFDHGSTTTGRFHSSAAALAAMRACGRRSPPMLIMPRRGLLAAALSLFASSRVVRSSHAADDDGAFPADFVWGASTASYQIEGAADEAVSRHSISHLFSPTPR